MPKFINQGIALKIIDNYAKAVDEEGKVVVQAVKDIIETITPAIEYPPCNIGDTIYEPYLDKVMQYTVNEIKITTSGTYIGLVGDFEKEFRISAENLGETFFLTFEEAEERLVREKEE
ncbi:MAG: hypothetical protein IJY73_06305 [Oscillospiraceae bacterium]|nr:hypothetical protein [Oscillospiraceae bacterium]